MFTWEHDMKKCEPILSHITCWVNRRKWSGLFLPGSSHWQRVLCQDFSNHSVDTFWSWWWGETNENIWRKVFTWSMWSVKLYSWETHAKLLLAHVTLYSDIRRIFVSWKTVFLVKDNIKAGFISIHMNTGSVDKGPRFWHRKLSVCSLSSDGK